MLLILGGAIVVMVLGPISISGYGDWDYILTAGLKATVAIILVLLWIVILSKMNKFIFKKQFNF